MLFRKKHIGEQPLVEEAVKSPEESPAESPTETPAVSQSKNADEKPQEPSSLREEWRGWGCG